MADNTQTGQGPNSGEPDKLLDAATRRIGNEPDTDPISDLDRLESRDLDNLDKETLDEDGDGNADSSYANDNPDGASEVNQTTETNGDNTRDVQ